MTEESARLPDRTYSPEEVADLLGTTPWWVRQRVRDGKAEHLRLGKARIRFTAAQVAALLADVTVAPTPAPPPEPVDAMVLGATVRSVRAHRAGSSIPREAKEVG